MEYWEAFKHWWDSVMAAASGTGHTFTNPHTNIHTHFLWDADKHKWLRLMMLQTLRKYRWFIFLKLCLCFLIWWSVSVHLYCLCSYVCTHMCDPSHWFWLSMIGSVMRCHKIWLIWSWVRNQCQMLPASFSLSPHTHWEQEWGGYVVFCLGTSPVYMHICISSCEGKHNSISVTRWILALIVCLHTFTLTHCLCKGHNGLLKFKQKKCLFIVLLFWWCTDFSALGRLWFFSKCDLLILILQTFAVSDSIFYNYNWGNIQTIIIIIFSINLCFNRKKRTKHSQATKTFLTQ